MRLFTLKHALVYNYNESYYCNKYGAIKQKHEQLTVAYS